MTRRFRFDAALAVGATLVLLAAPVRSAVSEPANTRSVDREAECNAPIPDGVSAGAVASGDVIELEVAVVLDGVTRKRADALMTKAAEAYAPLAIDLSPSYRKKRFQVHVRTPDGKPAAEMNSLLGELRATFGAARPESADLVYLLTDKDIYALGPDGPNYGVGGYAQCIGGVFSPGSAFAIGEGYFPYEDEPVAGPLMMYRNSSAKIAAHELGHLMGGRHEHGNCVEGIPSEVVDEGDYLSPCTLMAQQLFSINFGALEGAIVRHYAEEYASP